jgi:hypothetical protein
VMRMRRNLRQGCPKSKWRRDRDAGQAEAV